MAIVDGVRGMETMDLRRRCILQMADRLDLIAANIGNITTFTCSGYRETIPDISSHQSPSHPISYS